MLSRRSFRYNLLSSKKIHLYVVRVAATKSVTDHIEANGDETDDSKIKYETSFEEFSHQTKMLKKKLDEFEKEVSNCLKEIGVKDYIKITDCIIRGNCEPKF